MESDMATTSPEENKKLVLKAFDTLFNKRDYVAAEQLWSSTLLTSCTRRSSAFSS